MSNINYHLNNDGEHIPLKEKDIMPVILLGATTAEITKPLNLDGMKAVVIHFEHDGKSKAIAAMPEQVELILPILMKILDITNINTEFKEMTKLVLCNQCQKKYRELTVQFG